MPFNILQTLGRLIPEDGSPNPYAFNPQPTIDPNSQLAVAPLAMPQGLPQLPAMQTNAPGTRSRRSVLDAVGQIADVFAKVGGAQALYQPTLDGREDRELALADHARTVDMDGLRRTLLEQNVAAGETTAQTGHNEVLGRIAQAAMAYPEARRGEVFAALAQRAGITPEQMQGLTPELIQGAATAFTDKPDYGRQIAYDRTDPNNPRAYVVVNGRPQFLDGVTPALPTRQVDLGGGSGAVDPLTGHTVGRILPRTERPGAAEDRSSRERIAAGHDATSETNTTTRANTPRAGAAAAGASGTDQYTVYRTSRERLTNIRSAMEDLMNDPGLNQATGLGFNNLPSDAQRRIQGKIARIKGLGIPAAVAQFRAAGGQRPTQAEILAEAQGITGPLQNTNMTVGDYRAAIQGAVGILNRNVRQMDDDGRRAGIFHRATPNPQRNTGRTILPATPAARARVDNSGWGTVVRN